MTIGDVVGKGAAAAATAGAASHTLRGGDPGVASEPDPPVPERRRSARVSRSDMHSPYARIDLHQGAEAGSLSVGGHPPPLVLRSDGSVEPVGRRSPLAAETPSWLTTESIWPGERWCCTRTGSRTRPGAGGERRGAQRRPGPCAGERAGDRAGTRKDGAAWDGSTEPRDDIVVLVLRIPASSPSRAVGGAASGPGGSSRTGMKRGCARRSG